ncbi:MAG: hypothetical protein DI586_10135 [Micavibrio aeruginosavorus]|uniref:Uncharacterized protein n=1 Tax=Micavibrio aeruginosavorus TaxID=349221 RepID=A0A2W5FIV6_9BACT|nr:MAG: hypothetical protein DI586_10135 [Micavibrio aeruginosavorus]
MFLKYNRNNLGLCLSLVLFAVLNAGLWFYSNKIYTKWTNIPPAPKIKSSAISFLDDRSLAYRAYGLALQNFGSVGQTQSLKNYNYNNLGEWFSLMEHLDSGSHFMPYMAAYYFGATPDASQLKPVIAYLEETGMKPGPQNWRWLAQAAYLARHRLKDMDEALRIARRLGSIYKPPMPTWTRNMEPMLRADLGDKQAAYLLMLEILKTDGEKMSVSEYNANIYLTCQVILGKEEAAKSPLCQKEPKD